MRKIIFIVGLVFILASCMDTYQTGGPTLEQIVIAQDSIANELKQIKKHEQLLHVEDTLNANY